MLSMINCDTPDGETRGEKHPHRFCHWRRTWRLWLMSYWTRSFLIVSLFIDVYLLFIMRSILISRDPKCFSSYLRFWFLKAAKTWLFVIAFPLFAHKIMFLAFYFPLEGATNFAQIFKFQMNFSFFFSKRKILEKFFQIKSASCVYFCTLFSAQMKFFIKMMSCLQNPTQIFSFFKFVS